MDRLALLNQFERAQVRVRALFGTPHITARHRLHLQRSSPNWVGSLRGFFSPHYSFIWRLPLLSGLLSGVIGSASHVTVVWDDKSTNETCFKIERALDDLNFAQVATVGANISTFTDTTVSPSTTYAYRVRACNASGDSFYSNIITVTAPSTANTSPGISDIPNVTIASGILPRELTFTVGDAETPAENLVVTGASSNTTLVPATSLVFDGNAASRSLTITPTAGESGTATITVMVSDGGMTASDTFLLTVDAFGLPTMSKIADQVTPTGVSVGPISFAIDGGDVPVTSLTVSGRSSNTTLVPDANIIITGSGASRTITVLPAERQNGSTTITLSTSGGPLTAVSSFTLTVSPASTQTFSNTASIAIIGTAAALPYPSEISVSGLDGTIVNVVVELNGFDHSWGGDVDVLLVSPTGQNVLIMSDVGTGPTANVTLTLSDAATSSLPETDAPISGTYKPTNHDTLTDIFLPPAPLTYASTLAAFNGHPATGKWLLYVRDDMLGDSGSFRGGWSLTITTAASDAPVAPTLSDIPNQRVSVNTPTAAVPFTVSDKDTPVNSLVVSGTSSNTSLVPNSNLAFGGSGLSRTVRATPAPNQTGKSTIIVTVSDGLLTAVKAFVVTVDPVNIALANTPFITSAGSASAEVGVAFSYAITATNSPTSYDVLNLPPGLTLNKTTGEIAGTPTTSGAFDVTMIAANTNGAQLGTLAVHVAPAASPINQTVTIVPINSVPVVGETVTLQATATSGLPVTFSVVSGNAVVTGNTLTIHDSGVVTIRGTQGGSTDFNSASVELTLSNASYAQTQQIYTGTIASDPFAAIFDFRQGSGTLYSMISSTREVFVVPFIVGTNGMFTSTVQGFSGDKTSQGPARTFRGQILYGTLNGTITELGRTFTATLQPSTGPTKAHVGAYHANTIWSSSGEAHVVAGAQGQAYVLSMDSTGGIASTGTISPNGDFAFRTPESVVIEGSIDSLAKSIKGTIQPPNQASSTQFLGIEHRIPRTNRLANISTLVRISDESAIRRASISGIVVRGTGPRTMLLRAIGPTLATFGVTDALRNPRLHLFNSIGRIVAQNDNWGNSAALINVGDRVGAFGLAFGSLDSAMAATVNPGVYTLQAGSDGGDGVALVEIYDAGGTNPTSSLVNLSTQGYIAARENEIVGGFVVSGNAPTRVLVRGIGPTLQTLGVTNALNDPTLQIFQNSVLLAQNDDWGTPQPVAASQSAASAVEIVAASERAGAFQLRSGSKDAAIIITLPPGAYTAAVRGTNSSIGVGLLEIYHLSHD